MTRANIFLFAVGIALFTSCKKDRFVNCQFDLIGKYVGVRVSPAQGQTTYSEAVEITTEYEKGKLVVVFYPGDANRAFEVNDCQGSYTSESKARYSFYFFEDSLHINRKPPIGDTLASETNWYLNKE